MPRLSGRSWQTEAVKPENGCSGWPGRSALNRMMWNCTSGVASSGRVRAKMPPWPAPTVSGPVRKRNHSRPMSSFCQGLRTRSFKVIGRVQR